MNDPLTNNPSKPGAILAQERLRQNLTVNDVANKLRISIRQIEAMEADEYDKLPGVTFVRGFMRNYARLLHLDPEPLLQASGMSTNAVADLTPAGGAPSQHVRLSPEPRSGGGSSRGGRKALSAMLLIAVGAAIAWWLWQQWQLQRSATDKSTAVAQPTQTGDAVSIPVVIPGAGAGISGPSSAAQSAPAAQQQPGVTPAVPSATSASAATAAEAPVEPQPTAPAALGVIRFEFSAAARIELRDKSNFLIHAQLHKPSDITEIQVRPPVSLVIGNAKNVKMLFNGRPIDLMPYTDASVARFTLSDTE